MNNRYLVNIQSLSELSSEATIARNTRIPLEKIKYIKSGQTERFNEEESSLIKCFYLAHYAGNIDRTVEIVGTNDRLNIYFVKLVDCEYAWYQIGRDELLYCPVFLSYECAEKNLIENF